MKSKKGRVYQSGAAQRSVPTTAGRMYAAGFSPGEASVFRVLQASDHITGKNITKVWLEWS